MHDGTDGRSVTDGRKISYQRGEISYRRTGDQLPTGGRSAIDGREISYRRAGEQLPTGGRAVTDGQEIQVQVDVHVKHT